ncbi:hypothetical protein CORC01_11045 [Colletotrichum orchidophilum]|uniref:Uncharacterized protein n=1 Tax=Colletotrichum orchidophilum TaxID=1209926 RepID=A0A1G4AX65_9PEZI|nr:uncharacterized protein CORC01_11045 [Colletotrichum orchidophilum]OHE93642.1 hypothetical protein CORC01_11045 [Colletotrichum orchidophilum]
MRDLADTVLAEATSRSQSLIQRHTLSPGTNQTLSLWRVRWNRFVVDVLKKDITTTPVGEDVEKFFWIIHRFMDSKREKISLNYYKHALTVVLKNLEFTYPDFTWSSHHALRLGDEANRLVRRSDRNLVLVFEEAINEAATMCPLRWILVLALRVGQVKQRSYETLHEACKNSLATPLNGEIVWENPQWPLLGAFTIGLNLIQFDKPAGVQQIGTTLRQAADLVGMVIPPVTHDIRRGAAADLAAANLDSQASTTHVGRRLNHTTSSRDTALTDHYIGPRLVDDLKPRLQALDNSNILDFGPRLAQEPYTPMGKLRPEPVNEACVHYNLDPTILSERYAAAKRMREQHRTDWVEGQTGHRPAPVIEAESEGLNEYEFEDRDTEAFGANLIDTDCDLLDEDDAFEVLDHTAIEDSEQESTTNLSEVPFDGKVSDFEVCPGTRTKARLFRSKEGLIKHYRNVHKMTKAAAEAAYKSYIISKSTTK